MRELALVLFWLSLASLVYAYAGFPALVACVGTLRRRRVRQAPISPPISMIIAAYNEEESIAERLVNALSLGYPKDRLQIIVASDGSTDRTESIAARFANENVLVLPLPRAGKIHALNAAVRYATGEILVFTDANIWCEHQALRAIARNFADPEVGGVVAHTSYKIAARSESSTHGENLYWNYDTWLKSLESQTGSVVSAHGGLYAIRRDLFTPIDDAAVTDDFAISTEVIARGYRLVFEPAAVAREAAIPEAQREFRRRVRLMTRGLRGVLVLRRQLLNPFRYGFYAVVLGSHKVIRRLAPVFLIVLALASAALSPSSRLFAAAAMAQGLFYVLALAGLFLRRRTGKLKLLYIPFYYCMANAACAVALVQLFRGSRVERWEPQRHGGVTALLIAGFLSMAAVVQAQTPVEAGFRDFSFGSNVTPAPTGEKPESKLWWNDGVWWGSLFNAAADDYHIYFLDLPTQTWIDTGTRLDDRPNSKADVLWDDASHKLYLASHVFTSTAQPTSSSSQWARLYRYSYNPTSRAYTLDSGFPVTISRGKEEALTIAKDSVGRLWTAYVESNRVKINHSAIGDDTAWGTPVNLPASSINVTSDDIAAIIAFGGQVGVMWSNQNARATYFATHWDQDLDSVWQPQEQVVPGPICSGSCADDHLNLKSDQNGRVYATIKTSLTGDTQPILLLMVRQAVNMWAGYTISQVQDNATRPIVLLDENARRLDVFFTSPETHGSIYTKSTPLDAISFAPGLGTPFIKSATDTNINNPTSFKQSVTAATGILVLASDSTSHRYLHNIINLSGPAITSFSPSTGPPGTVVTINGQGLTGTTAVKFHQVSATFSVMSDAEIQATVPGTATTGRITVTLPTTTLTSSADFVVSGAPVISSFTPASGPAGTALTVAGSSFTGTSRVTVNGSAAVFSVVSDTSITATVPAGATTGTIAVTNGFGTAVSSGVFTVTTSGGTAVKDITFEGGSLTDPASGADLSVGTVMLETAAPVKGTYSARIPNAANAYLEENFTAADDLYLSFYVRISQLPSADVRIAQISDAGSTVGNVYLLANGRLRLRNGSTTIADSAPLSAGQIYRVGFHQRKGTGANAVLEAVVATGDAGFGAPFAALSTGSWTTAADRLRIGSTIAVAVDLVLDDIRLDAAVMPPPGP